MSSFGRAFKVTTFGESHCKGVGCIVDGVPARMRLTETDVQPQLSRRRPGQSALTTKRNEVDAVTILSGTECGVTLGTPIAMLVANQDQRPNDYSEMNDVPRPSHADYTYQVKYGVRASSGGGRSSARETIGRVAAGAIAEKWLKEMYGTEIVAWTSSIHTISAPRELESQPITRDQVDQSLVRCPHEPTTAAMVRAIEEARDAQDSIGGVVTCVIRQVPAGLGEPVFDKLEAMLAHAMLSIPATKGFEIGSGFEGTKLRGSQHNDSFVASPSPSPSPAASTEENKAAAPSPADYANVRLRTATNNSGGIQGGISNGENIVFRVAFKPPATIGVAQDTTDYWGNPSTLEAKGRHDPCVVPRAIAIVEAMAALVIADAALLQLSREASADKYPFIGNAKRAPIVFGDVPEAAAVPSAVATEKPVKVSTDDSTKLM